MFALILYMVHMGEYDLLFLLITTSKLQAPVQPSYEENIITAEYSHETMKKIWNKYVLYWSNNYKRLCWKGIYTAPPPPTPPPASFFF